MLKLNKIVTFLCKKSVTIKLLYSMIRIAKDHTNSYNKIMLKYYKVLAAKAIKEGMTIEYFIYVKSLIT